MKALKNRFIYLWFLNLYANKTSYLIRFIDFESMTGFIAKTGYFSLSY